MKTGPLPRIVRGPWLNPPAAVIFDMDGVLTDSEPLINSAAVAMFEELGLQVRPEDFHPFVGTGENRYLGGVAEKYAFPIDLPAAKRRTYEIYLQLVPGQLRAFPGAVDLVRRCRSAGFKVALASSADRIKIDANLEKIGLPPEGWDAVVTGEDVEHKKPAPDIFLAAARRLQVPPRHCVVIEDAVNGVEAAKAAGMRCVAVAQTFPADQLKGADLVRPTVAEIQPTDLARPWGWGMTVLLSLAIGSAFVAVWGIAEVCLTLGATLLGYRDLAEQGQPGSTGLYWAVGTLAAAPASVGLAAGFAAMRPGWRVRDYLALRPVAAGTLVRWGLVFGVFVAAADGLTWLLGRPIVPEVVIEAYRSAVLAPLLWLALVVGAPFAEEFLFRGFLFRGLLHSRLGPGGTVLTTALLWSAIHGQYDFYEKGIILGAGILLGWARHQTASLWTPLLLHAGMNLVATLQVCLQTRLLDG